MTAKEYRDLLLQRWWIVGLSILLVGLGAVTVTLFTPPVYQARALVQVDIPSTDTSVIVGVTRVVYTQAQLATSDAVLKDAAARTPGLTVAQLRSSVSATPLANENIIQVIARDPLPSGAVTKANDVALHSSACRWRPCATTMRQRSSHYKTPSEIPQTLSR